MAGLEAAAAEKAAAAAGLEAAVAEKAAVAAGLDSCDRRLEF